MGWSLVSSSGQLDRKGYQMECYLRARENKWTVLERSSPSTDPILLAWTGYRPLILHPIFAGKISISTWTLMCPITNQKTEASCNSETSGKMIHSTKTQLNHLEFYVSAHIRAGITVGYELEGRGSIPGREPPVQRVPESLCSEM
jgi:hypothetical protein